MSSDNWEKRFDAVVKETEEKLARVKGTLSRSASPNVNKYDKYDKYDKYSLKLDLDTRKASPEPYNRRNISFDRSINKSHDEVYEVSLLKRQIRELEKNRSKQEEETRALKGQISAMKHNSDRSQANIKEKMNEENVSQFDLLRKELKMELNSLKSSVLQQSNTSGAMRGEGRCGGGCTGEIEGLKKDLVQNRSKIAEELHEMKGEMDVLRSRMMRAELELSNTTAETKELDRKHGRIEKEVQFITETHRLQNKSTNNNIQSLSEAAAYVSQMRSNIGDLQQRFSSLENDLTLKMSSLQRTVDTPCSERGTPNVMQSSQLGSRGSSYRSSDSKRVKGSIIVSTDLSLDDLEDSICLDDLSDNAITLSQCSLLSNSPKPSSADTLKLHEEDDLITGLDDITSFNNYLNDEDDDLISGMSGLLSDDD